jgi:hypothetical protein
MSETNEIAEYKFSGVYVDDGFGNKGKLADNCYYETHLVIT